MAAIKTQPVTQDAQPGIHKEDLPISRTELHVTQQAKSLIVIFVVPFFEQ